MGTVPITIVSEDFSPTRGGAEKHLAQLARWLLSDGRPVRLFARRGHSSLPASVFELAPCFGAGTWAEWRFSRALDRFLGESGGVVFGAKPMPSLTHYVLSPGTYRRSFEAERESTSNALRRALLPYSNRLNAKRQWLLHHQEALFSRSERPPRLMVYSSLLKDELVRDFGVPAERIRISRPGVDLTRFHPWSERASPVGRPGEPRLVFVAHNFALKGLGCVLLAVEKARRQGLRATLDVVGNGTVTPFENHVRRLGLEAAVRFLRFLDENALSRLLSNSDALVHPTFHDPCSLVALEALACGCPVITTRRNGASEMMVSGRHGYVLDDPNDIDALTSALLDLGEPQKVDQMRCATLEIRSKLDFERHAREVADWLSEPTAR